MSDPLRVLVLSTRYPDEERPNLGLFVERQMRELAARPGVEVEVVAPAARPAAWRFDLGSRAPSLLPLEEVRGGIRVHRPTMPVPPWSAARPAFLAAAVLPLVRRLRERFPFDLISAEFSWPEGPAAAAVGRRLGVPVSIKARGMEFEAWRTHPLRRRQLLRAGRSAAGLLAVSGSVRESMVEAGLPPDRIALHYPAVDTGLFRPLGRARSKAALKLSGPVLLTVGNLIPEKRQDLAVDALAQLPEARLVVVGSGKRATELRERAGSAGLGDRLWMPGSIPQALLPTFYSAADVVIHPSAVEGFANVRLEALACGTPVVTTAAGEAERLVRAPATGRIVPGEANAIAAAVREILSESPDPFDVRRAALDYSWTRATDVLEGHFRALAASGRGSQASDR